MSNPDKGVRADFSRYGAVVRGGGVSWRLGLERYRYGTQLLAAGGSMPVSSRGRVVYRRGPVQEWYANGPLGLEQGLTLAKRPSNPQARPLTLELGRLPAGLQARLGADKHGAILSARHRDALRLIGLFASDATGREVPARIDLDGGASAPARR